MSVVVGTAGHIDHGKTSLLRALTGIDPDRLPEERRRGMTIEVGYAWLALPDGTALDFVDVPGHGRLVGNMLVGAGEIDAALLVVAADDGPRAQTLEHLELLDALGIRNGVAAVTKADLVDPARAAEVAAEVDRLLDRTSLAGSPVLVVSSSSGAGLELVRGALAALAARIVAADAGRGPARLAIDRVFSPRGRGAVVTGSLRAGALDGQTVLRLEPGGRAVRIRELQVHGRAVARAEPGRTAVNLAGVDGDAPARGTIVTSGPGVETSDRLLVALRPPAALPGRLAPAGLPAHGDRLVLHLGTEHVEVVVARGPRDAFALEDGSGTAVLRLARSIGVAAGDRFVLRWPSPAATAAGGIVLDPAPPRGVSRRRASRARLAALAFGVRTGDGPGAVVAAVDLHGALRIARAQALAGALVDAGADARLPALATSGRIALAPDVAAAVGERTIALVRAHHDARPLEPGVQVALLRAEAASALRRLVTLDRETAALVASGVVDAAVAAGRVVRRADRVALPGRSEGFPPDVEAAMDRLVAALGSTMPPPIDEAARAVDCPPEAVAALIATGRIVRLSDDVAFAATAYRRIEEQAVDLAREMPLTPATLRDRLGSSRKYVMTILEDLDRRGLLRRTPAGHVPGPRAVSSPAAATTSR